MATPERLFSVRVGPSSSPPSSTPHSKRNPLVARQYETVGEALTISEIASLRVGIPWLPPTFRRRTLLKKYDGPLDDFIRISLVTVSTKTLEQYLDDLDTIQPNDESAETLYIDKLKPIERYSVCALLFAGLFITCFCFSSILGSGATAATILSLLTSLPSAALATFSCMEIQRRASFYAVLHKELLRRRGQDDTNSKGVLISIET